jgi:transposase
MQKPPTDDLPLKLRPSYWTQFIKESREYPAGITAFITKKGVGKSLYYHWFRKLKPFHPEWNDLGKDSAHHLKRAESRAERELPKTEVSERPRRRFFSVADKKRILEEIDNTPTGKIAAVLRREGLYSSAIQKWRQEEKERGLEEKKRGPKPSGGADEIKKLRAELARSHKMLARANEVIQLQKKIAEVLRTHLEESETLD